MIWVCLILFVLACSIFIKSRGRKEQDTESKGQKKHKENTSLQFLTELLRIIISNDTEENIGEIKEIVKKYIESNYPESDESSFDYYLDHPCPDKSALFRKIQRTSSLSKINTLLETAFQMSYFNGSFEENTREFILELVSPIVGGKRLFSSLEAKYDKINKKRINERWNLSFNPDIISLALTLMAHTVLVDKSKMVCELEVIKKFIYKYDKDNFKESVSFVKGLLCFEYSEKEVKKICSDIKSIAHPAFIDIIMDTLFDVVYSDEKCSIQELNFLKRVANRLNISTDTFVKMQKKHCGKYEEEEDKKKEQGGDGQNAGNAMSAELKKAYAVLELTEDAVDSEIKATWRNLMRINHPDLVANRGVGAVEAATRRCQEINKAYEVIKNSRNNS